MAIKAKNVNVGGEQPPTKTENPSAKVGKIAAKNIVIGAEKPTTKEAKPNSGVSFAALRSTLKAAEPQPPLGEPPPAAKTVEEPKYIKKTDGELIRHINKKSTYLRDMLEISN